MAEEIAFENGRISNIQGLVTLILTLNRVILQTFVHLSSTSTYTPNLTDIKDQRNFLLTDGHSDVRTFETHFIRSTQKSRPKNCPLLWRHLNFNLIDGSFGPCKSAPKWCLDRLGHYCMAHACVQQTDRWTDTTLHL